MKLMAMVFILVCGWFANAADPFEEKTYKTPVREISIIATDDGFYPNKIMAFKGEKLRFFVTSTGEKKQCFLLQKHEIFLAVDRGKINEGEVTADQSGRFKFYCPANSAFGYLTIFEKNSDEQKQDQASKREPASTKPSYWIPRDHEFSEDER